MFPNTINMPINNAVLHNYALHVVLFLDMTCCLQLGGWTLASSSRVSFQFIKKCLFTWNPLAAQQHVKFLEVFAPGIPGGHQSSRCHWQPMLRGDRQAIFWVGRQIRAGALATSMGSSKLAMSKDWKYIGTWSKTMINHEGVGSRFQRRHTRAGIVSKWFRQTNQETHQTPIL